jgi:hypothetical protein
MKTPVPVTLYLDVWPGIDLSTAIATGSPGSAPLAGTRRYRVDFMVDDPNAPDTAIPPGHVQVSEENGHG